MINFILGIATAFTTYYLVTVVRIYLEERKYKIDAYRVIKEFCEEHNYCYFGCGGGRV